MVTLRPSAVDDAEQLAACVDTVARERRYLGNVHGFSVEDTRTFIESLNMLGGIQILASSEDQVIGWCDVTRQPFEGTRHVGRLGMGLLAAYRGHGWGRRLLHVVLDSSFASGLQRVELDVFASNAAAVQLYLSEGFVTEGRKRYARVLDGVEDDVIVMGMLRDEWTPTRSTPSEEHVSTAGAPRLR